MVLPPISNSRKLQIKWSGPLKVVELITQTMVKGKEMNVNEPRTYLAHRKKSRLTKKEGAKDLNPAFFLPEFQQNS